MWGQHLLVGVLWVAYGVVHSLLAATGVKKRLQNGKPRVAKLYRLGYNIIAFAGLAAIVSYQLRVPSPKLFLPTVFVFIAAGLIGATGLVVMAICIGKYFTGLSGLRNLWQEEASDKLIVSGIHRAVRHPLYLGTFLAIWGAWLALPTVSFLLSNIIITGYTLIGIRFEEWKLVAAFGDDYRRYKKTVPKLIPGVKATGRD